MLGWVVATALFTGIVAVLGFTGYDTYESVFSTWAIAHGQMACAFPKGFREIAPLYPLISGGIASVAHIGHTVPFPTRGVMGPRCDRAFLAIDTWSSQARALDDTVKISYLSWPVLMAGAISLLRVTGRGRRGWEPATLVVLACLPPVWTCIQTTFHPEDLLAMGFVLAALACALRGSWAGAGILIALAFLSHQFALLVAAPLLILAPPPRRLAFCLSAAVTVALVTVPLTAVSGSGAIHSIFLGTGNYGGVGGAVIWDIGTRGTPLLVLSRVLPIALSVLLALWVVHRLGPGAMRPVVVLSVVAVSLGFRLACEQQMFEYYFMALSVVLVLLDVIRGHIRSSLVAWLVVVPTVYLNDVNLPAYFDNLVPIAALTFTTVFIVSRLLQGRPGGQLVPWMGVIVATLISWHATDFFGVPHSWFWQVAMVVPGLILAARPLLAEMRRNTAAATNVPGEPWRRLAPRGT